MNIAVLGTGMAGNAIGTKVAQLRHQVMMGSRTADNKNAAEWVKANGSNAKQGTFADAAAFGEIIFNGTNGAASLNALNMAGAENMKGKILIDISNPLDFSKGMPPTLFLCSTDSLGEQIQRAFPEVKVVKTLNTVNCNVQVNPALIPGEHDIFMSGNDNDAKATVTHILRNWFGWKTVIDLGDITTARAAEMLLPMWVQLFTVFQTPNVGFKIVK